MRFYLICFFLISLSLSAFSQEKAKRKYKDLFRIKAPEIKYSEPDNDAILFEDEITSDQDNAIIFGPENELSLLVDEETDTLPYVLNEDFLNEETEIEVSMDCVWVSIAEYYSIWDTRHVNPYKVDPVSYKDTINFKLYDSINNLSWSMPLKNCPVNSEFGMRHWRWHYGTDLDLSIGDSVFAAFDGIVRVKSYDRYGYGNFVVLRHYNGLETLYGHLSSSKVKVGQLVKAGEVIGLGGNTGRSTGPHLHYEVRYQGNAINPADIYDFAGHNLTSNVFELNPSHFDYVREARKVVFHKIRSGDTLSGLSRKYRVSVGTICRLNNISTRSILRVGQRLRVR